MSENDLPYPAISTALAETWVNNWRDPERTASIANIKGFFMSHEDTEKALAESGAENLRMYIGLEYTGPEDDPKKTYVFHLLVVGVDSGGNDLIDQENELYVYDFSQPCPATCSETGPLK